jgi:CRP-like cAMP-binding protein
MDAFVRKMRHGARLNAEDERLLSNLAQPIRSIGTRRDILAEGDTPRSLPLILDGWACRYRLLANGKRQVITLFVPGDLC